MSLAWTLSVQLSRPESRPVVVEVQGQTAVKRGVFFKTNIQSNVFEKKEKRRKEENDIRVVSDFWRGKKICTLNLSKV